MSRRNRKKAKPLPTPPREILTKAISTSIVIPVQPGPRTIYGRGDFALTPRY
jgi:hypothetical protein